MAGITGAVRMDANGDRDTTYAIMDMNPDTGQFEVSINKPHQGSTSNATCVK